MSDFDREAEREKLREQLADEQEDRETTERMSELLLQGATMTNKHCDTCGDPVFRHEGQEFCPTCHTRANGQQAEQQGATAEQSSQQGTAAERHGGQAQSQQQDGTAEPEAQSRQPAQPERQTADETRANEPVSQQPTQSQADVNAATGQPRKGDGNATPTRTRQPATGDLSEAHGALVRTATRLAREAEASDDLGRTREYLAGAKEAAEALRAVRQAER